LQRFQPLQIENRKSKIKNLLIEKLPFFALSAASCAVTFKAQQGNDSVVSLEHLSFAFRLLNSLTAYLRYILKLLWPADLSAFYPLERAGLAYFAPEAVIAFVALAALTWFAFWQRRKRPYLLMGWLWFVGTLVPVIGLVQVGSQAMADRYTYLPAIGLFIAAVWGIAELTVITPARKPVAAVAAGMILVCYAMVTPVQILYWQNSETLERHALAVSNKSMAAYGTLFDYYMDVGEFRQAEECCRTALALQPGFLMGWYNLGTVQQARGRHDEAETSFQTALKLRPKFAMAYGALGGVALSKGKEDEAIQHFREALRLDPEFPGGRLNVAGLLARQGRVEEAKEQYQECLRIHANDAEAHAGLGGLLLKQRQWEAAIHEFRLALEQEPQLVFAQQGLGSALTETGDVKAAAQQFSEVLRVKPNDADAHFGMAAALTRDGRTGEAAEHYRSGLRLQRDNPNPDALNNLAWILATDPESAIRNGEEAVHLAERACQLDGYKKAVFVGTLAAAYAEAGRFDDAVKAAEKAHDLATAAGEKEVAERNEQLLEVYKEGKAYHETRR